MNLRWHLHAGPEQWAAAAASQLAQALDRELAAHREALLLISGGSTPEPVYRALVEQPIEWPRVRVGLVDERFVPQAHPASNAHLLAQFAAVGAEVWPLLHDGSDRDACAEHANTRLASSGLQPCAIALGMGDDGHTASLFPGSADLHAALTDKRAFVGLDASGCPVAGDWTQRITLTPAGWQPANTRLLLLRGARKRDVLEAALAANDPLQYPILNVLDAAVPLHVHWSP